MEEAYQQNLDLKAAGLRVATADLLPHFSITGSMSLQAERFQDLFESASTAGLISPGFNGGILNYGRLIAAYKAIGGGWEIRYGIRRGSADGMIEQVTAIEPLPGPEDATPELPADKLPPVPTDQI